MFAISIITFIMPSIGATLLPELYNGTTYARDFRHHVHVAWYNDILSFLIYTRNLQRCAEGLNPVSPPPLAGPAYACGAGRFTDLPLERLSLLQPFSSKVAVYDN